MRATQLLLSTLAAVVWLSATAHTADAQGVDIEIPVLILDDSGGGPVDDGSLDLANIVQSAAKGVTTVQEAPAIVTVITADDIKNRGWTSIQGVIDTVPGYMELGAIHNQFPFPLTRGILQATMFMMNGVAMFDPMLNVPSVNRLTPLETVKRVELITGPGGVLWGANSYLGIVNVITKDASDVDGVEADVGFGHGNGDREYMRGYVMTGVDELWNDDSSLFVHTSFETYRDAGYEMPRTMFNQPSPQPNSNMLYGPLIQANPERSFLFNLNGRLTAGKINVNFSVPFSERHASLGFPGFVTEKDLIEDSLTRPDGTLECDPNNPPDPLYDPSDRCLDVDRRARANDIDFFDRYVSAEYRTRLAGGKAGITVKSYAVQFVRTFPALGIISPLAGVLEGGLGFTFDATNYRVGAGLDGDIELPGNARLLYGGEVFREWLPDNVDRSRQGAGAQASFIGPYQLERLPLICPRQRQVGDDGNFTGAVEFVPDCPLTFAFEADRVVASAYINPQWKLAKNLTLDAGARVLAAPDALGSLSYSPETLFSGALVYGFAKDWHIKLNYAEGFRAPVMNNLTSNGEAVQIGGDPSLVNERSQAAQAEINARLFKGERRIRELNFRADYSYSKLEDLIQIAGGRYGNSADRGIHSGEFLGNLYVQGGHQLALSYTYMKMDTADKGAWRVMPEHWFHLTGIFALSENLQATSNLRVVGSTEDPNRLVEYRNFAFDEDGAVINTMTGVTETQVVSPTEVVLDRLPATADMTLGLAYSGINRLRLSAFAYNAFNGRTFQPDAFGDYEPRFEVLANPAKDFRFQVHATYNY